MKNNHGFTFLELISVVLLMSILFVYAISNLSNEPFEERLFYDEIISGLLYAQKIAISSGCNTQFLIDSKHYELNIDTKCSVGGSALYTTPVLRPAGQPGQYAKFEFPKSIKHVVNQKVSFYPQGWACRADGNSQDTLEIQIAGQKTRTIHVICSTGFVREV